RGAVAGTALAIRSSSDAADTAPGVRFTEPARFRPQALVQPLALHPRAPSPRQSEPRPPPHVLGALSLAAGAKRDAARRANRKRSLRLTLKADSGRQRSQIAQGANAR